MRALVAHGVFQEPSADRFALNAAGELLRRDVPGSQRAGVLFTAGAMRWELWSDFLECVRTGNAAIERAFGKTIFERHAENAEEAALFREATLIRLPDMGRGIGLACQSCRQRYSFSVFFSR